MPPVQDPPAARSTPLVLVVDDSADQRDLMSTVLTHAGLAVETAVDGEAGLEAARRSDPDLVTLDVTMPGIDGIETCRRLRAFSDAYVIMVTGRSAEVDRLVSLETGADDYLVKPCSPRELVARASALLRRPRTRSPLPPGPAPQPGPAQPAPEPPPQERPVRPDVVDAGHGLVLHPVRHVALLDGSPLPLTPAEIDLLGALTTPPIRTWWRAELVREVWHGDFVESDYLVDVHVASLRRKLRKADSGRNWIRTVEGSGYELVVDD